MGGEYERQTLVESLDGRLALHGETLGLDLLSHDEDHARAEREAAARQREVALQQAAEARVAELEALIDGKRG